jgi:hypothetical protein
MLASGVRILDHWDGVFGLDDGYGESSQLEPVLFVRPRSLLPAPAALLTGTGKTMNPLIQFSVYPPFLF